MDDAFTIEEWERKIAEQVRSLRLRLNLPQAVVSDRAGISLTAIKNLESGNGAAIKTLIKVLRVYGREDWLNTLASPVTVSPLQMLHSKSPRMRAANFKKLKIKE
jgi:transcriptional regulator with XRE-family HTH domain